MAGEAGKGDTRRPRSITREEWNRKWDETFPPSHSVIVGNDSGDENDYKQK